MGPLGEYGGEVLRPVVIGGSKRMPRSEIPADVAMTLPATNRRALAGTGKVRWYEAPSGAAAPARAEAQRFKVGAGPGKFLVVEGVVVTPEPVDKDTANALVGQASHDVAA